MVEKKLKTRNTNYLSMNNMQSFHEIYSKNYSIVDLPKFITDNKKLFKDTKEQVNECFEKMIEGDSDGVFLYQDGAVIAAIVACDFYRQKTEPNAVITKKLISKVEKDINENAKSLYIKYTLAEDTAKFEITEEESNIPLESIDFINTVKESLIPKAVEINTELLEELEEPDKKKETTEIKEAEAEEIKDQKDRYDELNSSTKKEFTNRIDSLKEALDKQVKALQEAFAKSKEDITEEMELVLKMHKGEMEDVLKITHNNTLNSKAILKSKINYYALKSKMYKKGSSIKTIAKISAKEVVTKDLSLIKLILMSISKNKTTAQEGIEKFINNNIIDDDKPRTVKTTKSDSEEDKPVKKTDSVDKPVKKVVKIESSDSEDDKPIKKAVKKPVAKKELSDSEEDKPAKKVVKKPAAKKAPVKTIKKYMTFDDIGMDSD